MAKDKDLVKRFKQFQTSKDVRSKIDLEAIKGDKGDKGDTGPKGASGPMGPKGADSNVPGMKGDTGLAGPQGGVGAMGPQGEQGPLGLQGPEGPLGPMPDHEIKNGRLRFEKSTGVWGSWISIGELAHAAAGGAGDARIQAVIDKQPPSGGGTTLTIQDEGTPLVTDADTLNFVGGGIVASGAGATKTITVPRGAGGTLQDAYDAAPAATPHILVASGNPMRWQSAVSGPVVQFRDTLGANIFEVDDTFVEVDGQLRIVDAFTNHGSLISLTMEDTFTTGGGYIGGGMASTGTVTYDNSFFIWALLAEQKTYNAAAGPGFAAFTLFNALPVIQNSGNFDLVQALILNNGCSHRRTTAGTSSVTQTIGLSNSPNTRANVSGAVMTKTSGDTAVRHSPTFATVAGSTVNLGTQIGLDCVNPAVALFQTQAGVENMTAYVGLRMNGVTFGGASRVVNVIQTNLAAATNVRVINSTGNAQSTHNGNFVFDADLVGSIYGASQDCLVAWAGGTNSLFFQFAANVDQLHISNPAEGRIEFGGGAGGAAIDECNFNFAKGAFGEGGAAGNNKWRYVLQSETITVGGEFTGILNTFAGNDTIDAALSTYAAWTVNAPNPVLGTGSLSTAVALNVGGNPTGATVNRVGLRIISNPSGGSGINAALWVTAGLSRFDGRVDINNAIALGGGAAATLGNIGGTGPTAAAQATWVEIDVGGVAHWIPAWT